MEGVQKILEIVQKILEGVQKLVEDVQKIPEGVQKKEGVQRRGVLVPHQRCGRRSDRAEDPPRGR